MALSKIVYREIVVCLFFFYLASIYPNIFERGMHNAVQALQTNAIHFRIFGSFQFVQIFPDGKTEKENIFGIHKAFLVPHKCKRQLTPKKINTTIRRSWTSWSFFWKKCCQKPSRTNSVKII